jgi:hypothetical protein
MNKKSLIVFGDSWARGAELSDNEKSFGELVAEKFNLNYSNYSQPASSITHLVVQLKDFLKKLTDCNENPNEWIAIFFLTGKERHLSWLNNDWTFHTPHGAFANRGRSPTSEEAHELTKLYYKYFFSEEQTDLYINTSLITVQSICQQYKIQDHYIAGWQQFNLWPEVDNSKIYKNGKFSCANFFDLTVYSDSAIIDNKNSYIYPNISHPNQQGHQLIADQLVEWIVCA